MKKTIIFVIVLGLFYISIKLFFGEKLNPSKLIINNKVIDFGNEIYVKSIFGNYETANSDNLGLMFGKIPSIKYPEHKSIYIILSKGKENAYMIFKPQLNSATLKQYSKSSENKNIGNCIVSRNNSKLYILQNGYGYIVESNNSVLKNTIVEYFCQSKE